MSTTDEAVAELNAMLDEGVNLEVIGEDAGAFTFRVVLDDAGCADCLVPDDTLRMIAQDALTRRGATVRSIAIQHAPA